MHDVEPHLYATVIREMIRHENDVTNHRIMWLLIGQGLIANAYVNTGAERRGIRGDSGAGRVRRPPLSATADQLRATTGLCEATTWPERPAFAFLPDAATRVEPGPWPCAPALRVDAADDACDLPAT